MTIEQLKKALTAALTSLSSGNPVADERVEAWAVELERIDGDPGQGSWQFSANQLRDAKGSPAEMDSKIRRVISKLEQWFPSPGSGS